MRRVALLALASVIAGSAAAGEASAAADPTGLREPVTLAAALHTPDKPRGGRPLAGAASRDPVAPGVLLVTTTTAAARPVREHLQSAAEVALRGASSDRLGDRVTRVRVRPGTEAAATQALRARPGVLAVERAHYARRSLVPNDTLYEAQWSHQLAGAERAWDVTTGASSVRIAIIDSGVDGRHPDLAPNLVEQVNVVTGVVAPLRSDNEQCTDGSYHGTHVAGIAAARGGNSAGVAGVSWRASVLDLAVFQESGGQCFAGDDDVIAAIGAAVQRDADVINLSLGGVTSACSTAFQTAVDEARAAGAVVVAAAGNHQQTAPGAASVPASCNGVLSVGAVGRAGQVAPYSAGNPQVDLVAPGGTSPYDGPGYGVLSSSRDRGFSELDGTSMAAPYVAGSVALLRAVNPSLTPDQVESILERTAQDVAPSGRDNRSGWGSVDVGAAVAFAASGSPVPAPEADPVFPVGTGDGGGAVLPPSQPEVFRVSAGQGRTEPVTQAVAMSQRVFPEAGSAPYAVLARSNDYADALAGSSLAYGVAPLLFTSSSGPLAAPTRAELQRLVPPGAEVFLLGGSAALPLSLEGELQALGYRPARLSGQERQETAARVADQLYRTLPQLGETVPSVAILATGDNWPDGVAGGSLSAFFGVPVLLTSRDRFSPATRSALGRLPVNGLIVLGGSAVISDATIAEAVRAAGLAPGDAVRLAGSDRFQTAVEVARFFEAMLADDGAAPGCVTAVNLIRADGYAHVLSASMLSGALACVFVPLGGLDGSYFPPESQTYVAGFGVDGVLAGDVDLLRPEVADQLRLLLRR
ncbi:MAG: S8 family serine peptidase [Mycobacteriales bacterium]